MNFKNSFTVLRLQGSCRKGSGSLLSIKKFNTDVYTHLCDPSSALPWDELSLPSGDKISVNVESIIPKGSDVCKERYTYRHTYIHTYI